MAAPWDSLITGKTLPQSATASWQPKEGRMRFASPVFTPGIIPTDIG